MRRTTAALALLGTLTLTSCATAAPSATPTGTGAAVSAAADPTDLLDCSPILKSKLDPDLFDTSKCWTTPDAPAKAADSATTQGGAVYMLVQGRAEPGKQVIARNASDGKKLWKSPSFEDIAKSARDDATVIHNFGANGTDAIAVGHPLSPQGYRVTIFDAKTGKELSRNDSAAAVKEITWGAGAVALKSFEDKVSVLTLGGGGFNVLPGLPWDSKPAVAAESMSAPVVGNRVIYATGDRLVLDMAAPGTPGAVITDSEGVKVGVLPAGASMAPRISFCGDFALVDRQDGTPAAWYGLSDGAPAERPGCGSGSYFPAGFTSVAFAESGSLTVSRIGNGGVSTDGRTVIVGGAGIYGTTETRVVPLKQLPLLYGVSSTMAYDPVSMTNIVTGQVETHADMTGLSGVGVVASGEAAVAVFKGDWGVGGAPLK